MVYQEDESMKHRQRMALLFDGSCNFCTASAELLRLLDWRHGLHCLPFQAPAVPQTYGLTTAQCEQTVWAISADGPVYQGAQAVSAVLDVIVPVPVFLLLYRFPALKRMEDTVYAWVANHRRFSQAFAPIVSVLASHVGDESGLLPELRRLLSGGSSAIAG